MKKTVVAFVLPIVLILVLFGLFLYYRSWEGIRFMKAFGNGINIGNDLDVTGTGEYKENPTIYDYETDWGNVPADRALFQMLYDAGFRNVRIPVSFGEHLDESGGIQPEWLDRVQEVVDFALDSGLYVILDTHHEDWICPTEEKEAAVTEELTSIWGQLAERFRDYDDRLLFESMNEPRLIGTAEEWTAGTEAARAVVNRLNAAFVETVRSTGGENETRWLLLPGYCSRYSTDVLEAIELPKDRHLMVAIHAYLPYRFTSADQGHEHWHPDDPKYTEDIETLRDDVERLFLKKKIPVMITEFGCEAKESEEERLAWATYYTDAFRELGVPCIWWDNGKEESYAVVDRAAPSVTHPELVDILVAELQ